MLTLKQFRNKYKLTQKELASILGITPTTLSKYEHGEWRLNQCVIDLIKEQYGEDIRPLLHKTGSAANIARKQWVYRKVEPKMMIYRETPYLFYCGKCEAWLDREEPITKCPWCGGEIKELHEGDEERDYFFERMAHTGYKIIPLERQRKREKDNASN